MNGPLVEPGNMMIVRPRNCTYCGHGYYGLQHVVQYAQQIGAWEITDLTHEQANKDPIYEAIDLTDPGSFYGFGHGGSDIWTGDAEQGIFTSSECGKLSGRVVYLLSCLTAQGLGPAIMEQGAVAYAGYDISWTWLSESDPGGDNDPYDDIYAKGFWESGNELWMALLDGYDFFEALQQTRAMYNEWIEYWLYENPSDPYAEDCIMWLVHDRDGLVGLPSVGCEEYTTEEQCILAGCRWSDGVCLPKAGGVSLLAAVAVIAIVGVALIVTKK